MPSNLINSGTHTITVPENLPTDILAKRGIVSGGFAEHTKGYYHSRRNKKFTDVLCVVRGVLSVKYDGKKYKLRNVGFFAYSREEGTVAGKMPEQIPEAVKQKRLVKLVKAQKRNVLQINRKLIGKELDVVYEGIDYEQELFFGRTQRQAPEIDTLVYFTSKTPVDIGEMYKIKIKKVKDYDIKGEKIDEFAE